MIKNKNGFILLLTLMIISLCSAMILAVLSRSVAHKSLATISLEKEQAKMVALGGIQIAISELTYTDTTKSAESSAKQQAGSNIIKSLVGGGSGQEDNKMLLQIFTVLNTWQTFEFTTGSDGFDAKLQIYISCENGKIELNQFFDSEKKLFTKLPNGAESRKILQWIEEKTQQFGIKSVAEPLERLFKKQQIPFVDVTQIMEEPEFKNLNIFPTPPDKANKNLKKQIYLADLFTVDSDGMAIMPWAISDSLLNLMGGKQLPKETESQKAGLAEKLKSSKLSIDLEKEWNKLVTPIYGIEWNNINTDLKQLFLSKFEPTAFSVVCQATVGRTTQRLVAIIAKNRESRAKSAGFTTRKLYWL